MRTALSDLRPLITWPAPPAQPRPDVRERLLLLALVALSCALRLVQVNFSLDTDEVFSVRLAGRSFAEVIDGALWDRSHPPLHLLMLHAWLGLFGTTELAARSLSILASAVFLVCAHVITRRVAGRAAAAALVLMIAVSPFFVYYGQQARPYSLIAALGALSLLSFMRAMDAPERSSRWFAWGASAAALVYAQYMGVLLLAMEALVALLCLRRRALWPVALLVACVLTVSPWFWAAMGSHVAGNADPLDLIAWMAVPTPRELGFQLVAAFGDGPVRASVLLAFVAALLVVGVALLVRRGRFDALRLLMLLGAVVAPVGLFAIARGLDAPVFAPRQMIGSTFCLLVLLAACVTALPRVAGALAWLVLLACAVLALPNLLPATRNPDWRAIAAYFDVDRDGAAVQSAEPWITDPLSFYRRRGEVFGRMPMTAGRQGTSSLLLCRPERCDLAEFDPSATPVRSWRWGKDLANELRVYERAR